MTQSILDWLCEDNNPGIKFMTLRDICGLPTSDPRLADAYEKLRASKPIERILSKLDADDNWETKDYGGQATMRYFTSLAETGFQRDPAIDKAVEKTALAMLSAPMLGGCADALTLRALAMMGYAEDTLVSEAISRHISYQMSDGGFICERLLNKRPDRKSCYKAALETLMLYAECKLRGIVLHNSEELCAYFAKRDILYNSEKTKLLMGAEDDERGASYGWRGIDAFHPPEPMRIGIHNTYKAATIMGLDTTPMRRFIEAKRMENGRFNLDGTLSKQPCSFGTVKKENKYITYYIYSAEKYAQNK